MKPISGGSGAHLLPLVATLLVIVIDREFRGREPLYVHGLSDEVAHALTGLIVMLTIIHFIPSIRLIPGLVGSIAIDLDHTPELLGIMEPDGPSSRFVTHSFATVACLVSIAMLNRNRSMVWGSVAIGVAIHLFRDAATGNIIAAWPLSNSPFSIPYEIYLGTLVTSAALLLSMKLTEHRIRVDALRPGDRLHE